MDTSETEAFCRNFRPYAQAMKTITLGCVNCGKMAQSHPNYCEECSGTGKGPDVNNQPDDNLGCHICGGSGRRDGFWKVI